jgi:phosphatidyl-myo-inositol dimannoside synthase
MTQPAERNRRILVLTYEYPPGGGGIGRYVSDLVSCLRQLHSEPLVVGAIQPGIPAGIASNNVFSGCFPADFLRLLRIYFRFRPATVILGHPLTWRIFWPLSLIHRDYIGIIYGSEITLNSGSRTIRNLFWRNLFLRAKRIIVISKYSRKLLTDCLPDVDPSKIDLIYPALGSSWFEKKNRRDEIRKKYNLDGIVLLTLARIVPRKGHELLIRALPGILSKRKRVVYLVAGSGSERANLEGLAADLGVSQNVVFTGYADPDDLVGIYDACDLFVMPTREDKGKVEGFGYSYIEAAARGKTSIAGNHGGATEAVIDGLTGLLVNPHDSNELADRILSLLDNDGLRRNLESNAISRAFELFHMDHLLRAMAVLFSE